MYFPLYDPSIRTQLEVGGEMAYWFRALPALTENPDLLLSTHTVVHNYL